MMLDESSCPVERLESALAIRNNGRVARPLDVIGLIRPASKVNTPRREALWRRLFLEAPLPYWSLVTWARKLSTDDLDLLISETTSPGWKCVQPRESSEEPLTRSQLLHEVADRFDAFNPYLYPWGNNDKGNPPHRQKFVLGRDLAQSYLREFAGDEQGVAERAKRLFDQQPAWEE